MVLGCSGRSCLDASQDETAAGCWVTVGLRGKNAAHKVGGAG